MWVSWLCCGLPEAALHLSRVSLCLPTTLSGPAGSGSGCGTPEPAQAMVVGTSGVLLPVPRAV